MFTELCLNCILPDIEFFVNKRDFPLLKNNETESYDNMFGPNTPLCSHNYPSYLPILGMTTTKDHADIPIPTWEDWTRIVYYDSKKHFPSNIKMYSRGFSNILWSSKKEIAVFRGQSSGIPTTLKDNIRLKFTGHLAKFSDLEEGFGNEFQSKMNDFNQEISSNNFPSTEDAFGTPDDDEMPF